MLKESYSNYKTELCKSWGRNNYCMYKEKCCFAHGLEELSAKKLYNYKQQNCEAFYTKGYCLYGARCNYIHHNVYSYKLKLKMYSFNDKRLNVFRVFK